MTASEIRRKFLDYFEGHGHAVIASSSLVPKEDPTLLFTNAGMNQFKNLFLGQEERGYRRATTSQKCVRAGGKHNDLENVGFTSRHHTFFEMLGNFSFGDYFKEGACEYGWEFLTGVMGLPKEKLYVTIFRDDDDAFEIWNKKIGVPKDRIFRMDEKDNFWMMGETGPCGPCSEIIYDQGAGIGCGRPECNLYCDCDRHLELWNLVFMQFERDPSGTLTPLPKQNIDTGMGLERLAAVLQGVRSNYDTDLFANIIHAIEKLAGKRYGKNPDEDISIRAIADHSRAVTFLISDGILPSNEGRGYVLRRILRRAARHGKLLGIGKPFLNEIVPVVIDEMKDAYPELLDKQSYVKTVVINEEQRFIATLDAGLRILNEEVDRLKGLGEKMIPGGVVFKLYDTFGFPTDLTADAVRAHHMTIDLPGFEAAMDIQREKARESWKGSGEESVSGIYRTISMKGIATAFVGYEGNTEAVSRVSAILKDDRETDVLSEGERGEIFVDETPFYGKVGGQIGDVGIIEGPHARFDVWETQRPLDTLFAHIGKVKKGTVRVGDTVVLKTDTAVRRAIEANHSGTHILQAALRQVLGDHVKQSGSLVNAERFRFDFTHFARVEDEEIEKVEWLVNEYIRRNISVNTSMLPREEAMKSGAIAVFDEKYGDMVRLVKMGDVSMELCGGTHVLRTGDIGFLKILHESSVAAGVRRIEAVTGSEAVRYAGRMEQELKKAARLVKANPLELAERVEKVLRDSREMEKDVQALKSKVAVMDSAELTSRIKTINGVKVLASIVTTDDVKALRDFGDKVRDRIQSGIILIGSTFEEKCALLCMVTKDLTDRYHAGNIIKEIAPVVGGSGGGRPDMAQAGGTNPEKLEEALAMIEKIVSRK
ncbi:MAG: alanine--tRNA ligase [Deltaproteobacteria bacterium]|nr:alanine--tRNA ligase [Deltaproteobacteria bacterium]